MLKYNSLTVQPDTAFLPLRKIKIFSVYYTLIQKLKCITWRGKDNKIYFLCDGLLQVNFPELSN